MIDLLDCTHCEGAVGFHSHQDGTLCHLIVCSECGALTDLSGTVPMDEVPTDMQTLQAICAAHWNRRNWEAAQLAKQKIEAQLFAAAAEIKKKYFPEL